MWTLGTLFAVLVLVGAVAHEICWLLNLDTEAIYRLWGWLVAVLFVLFILTSPMRGSP